MRRAALLLAVFSALALAACGGDDDNGPSREDYVADADAICERINEDLAELNEQRPSDIAEFRETLDSAIELTQDGIQEFEELEPPEDVEDDVDDFLGAAREQVDLLEEAREADSLPEAGQILQQGGDAIEEQRRDAAREIGFEECGG